MKICRSLIPYIVLIVLVQSKHVHRHHHGGYNDSLSHIVASSIHMQNLINGSKRQILTYPRSNENNEQQGSSNKEIFYFDVDHDFGDFNDYQVRRSHIPIYAVTSTLTVHNMSTIKTANAIKKDDLDVNNSPETSDAMPEDFDDNDESQMDNDDLEAQDNLDYYNEGAGNTGASNEEDEDDEQEDENEEEETEEEDVPSTRDQTVSSWGSSSQGQDAFTGISSISSTSNTSRSSGSSSPSSSSSNPSSSSSSNPSSSSSSNPSSSSSSNPSSSSSSNPSSSSSSSFNLGSGSPSPISSSNSLSSSSSNSTTNFSSASKSQSSSSSYGSSSPGSSNINSDPSIGSSAAAFGPGNRDPSKSSSSSTNAGGSTSSTEGVNSEFSPTTEEEEGISNAVDDDDDDDDDEEESFDSDSQENDSDPEENDGGDYDNSEDGSEDDLEKEEEGDADSDNYQYNDYDSEDSDGSDNDVLDQNSENEDEKDEGGGDDNDNDDVEEGEDTPEAREINNKDQSTQQSPDATSQQGIQPNTHQGLFGGLKRLGKKIFGWGKKKKRIRLRKMRKKKLGGRLRLGHKHKGRRHRHKMGSKMIKMGGKMIRLPGRKIKIKVKKSMKVSLTGSWDWRRYIRGFKYEMVGKANIGFLVDGSIIKHIAMIQRWVYNLALLFARGSYVSIGSFGGSVNLLTDFKTFASSKEIQGVVQTMKPIPGGRKIGEALEFYYPLFKAARSKSKLPSVLFIYARGKNAGNRKKMLEYKVKYRKLGVVIFVFGLGSRISISEFSMLTPRTRVMSAVNYKAVILGGKGLRLGYRPGMRRSIFLILYSRLSRWLGMRVGVASKITTHHHGHSHREWWFSRWNWYRYLGLRYGSLGRANVAFVIDASNAELIMFIQRYVYNIIRLFQQQGTYVTLMAYGRNQYIVTRWSTFASAQAVQTQASSIPFIQTKTRNTGAALLKMLRLYKGWMKRNNAAKIPNILFLISTGVSSDSSKFLSIREMYRKLGVHLWAFGIGPEGKKVSLQLKYLATNPRYSIVGDISGLIQKPSFTILSGGLLKIVGSGNAMQYTVGNPGMVRIQLKWNWRIGMRSIRYGYLSRANIGILVDGVQPKNFGFLRRFVYNIIRMYSLAGTYISIMIYGSKVYRVSNFVQVRGPMDIRNLMMKMPKVANGARRTGAALQAMLQGFGDAPPGNPNILYVIMQGPSSDDVTIPAASLRKFGIKAFDIGIGPTVSPKELATIAFSSSTIFKSGPNGLVHTLSNLQRVSASISGTVSKACGRSGHTRCRKKDIVKQWQWKTYGVRFTYSIVRKANLMFLIDGTNKNHFDVLQKLTYNIYKLFSVGTKVSIITYGGGVDTRLSMFRTFTDVTAFQTYLSSITYRGVDGRKIGGALANAMGYMKKAPAGRKILFLFATGKSDDDVTGPAKAMVNQGVSIFALGIGKDAKAAEMKKISRYYLTTRWKGLLFSMVKIQNSLVRVAGKAPLVAPDIGPQPDAPAGDPARKPPLPVPTIGFISSSSMQPIGLLQTKWDWFKMMNIKAQGLNAGNVVIMLDVSKRDNFDILIRFVAQLIMMFKFKDTAISLVTFSDTPSTAFAAKTFGDPKEVINALKAVEPKPSKRVKTGKALLHVMKEFVPALQADKERVGVLFLITRTKSSDDMSKGAEQIKGSGTKGVGIGVGGDISQEEVSMLALNGQLGLSGPVAVLPALVTRIMFGLTTIVNGPPSSPIMSLTTMAGKLGPALASGVMNSVQTGSVPSETTGQKGQPNTGALAGDATGADSGGGSAGDPEQGGASDSAGKPDVTPPASGQQPVGGQEAAGGETGAGGTDVSAGGGAAGASEAAAGASKQDGGAGGPADGTVTTGDSSKPVNVDGTPAAVPVAPDGGAVPPTNPDGTTGTGPANPDGTPVNPPPGTTPDGEPAKNPDGSPAEPPAPGAGNNPSADATPPGGTTTNPDGSTTTTNPDGSKTTTKPDGSSTTNNEDGSATTTQPDGTTMNKKPDGTVITTKPDGTTSVDKIAPDANPDGTPMSDTEKAGPPPPGPPAPVAPVGETTKNPDGSTSIKMPDGTLVEAQPDGTTSTTKPDGSTTTTKPDGSATTTQPDGTTLDKKPDGKVTTTKPDGTSTVTKVAPDANPDGSPTQPPPPQPAADSIPSPDGSTTETKPDGSSTTTTPDGTTTEKKPDGTTTETKPDGTSTVKKPDGSATTTKPDGTTMDKKPDGTVTTTTPEGTTEVTKVDPNANPDGSPTQPPPAQPAADGTLSPDSSPTEIKPSTTTTSPDGTTTETRPDGSTMETKPDGTSTIKNPDGSATTTKPDGTKMEKTPDGSVTTTNPDGTTSESQVPQDANPDGSPTASPPAPAAPAADTTTQPAPTTPEVVKNPDGSTTAKAPDGTTAETQPDGSSKTTKPDGTVTEAKPDGSQTTKEPDGTTTVNNPDGSAITTKPDGTKMEKKPDGTVTTTNPDGSTSTSNVSPDANPDGSPKEPAGNAAVNAAAAGAGGCMCAGKCPPGCVPVMIACKPNQKNCIKHTRRHQPFNTIIETFKKSSGEGMNKDKSEASEINDVQKLLEEFYDDESSEETGKKKTQVSTKKDT